MILNSLKSTEGPFGRAYAEAARLAWYNSIQFDDAQKKERVRIAGAVYNFAVVQQAVSFCKG